MKNESSTVTDAVLGGMTKMTGMDAIANTANSSFLGGGGMDGTIHGVTGRELLYECRLLGGCKTGQTKIINTYNMGCRHVIHTAGLVWNDGICGKQEKLSSCYRNSLLLTLENGVKRVTFPFISAGMYYFPVGLTAETAIGTVRKFVVEYPGEPEYVLWVLFDARTKLMYDTVLRKL